MSRQGARFHRKPGTVVSVRLRPDDCLRILDIAEKTGVKGTFPQKVSLVLNGLLVAAEQSGVISTPDMFQYGPRMQQALGHRNGQAVTQAVISRTAGEAEPFSSAVRAVTDASQVHAAERYSQLEFKQEYDAENFTDDDRLELENCRRIAWPDA